MAHTTALPVLYLKTAKNREKRAERRSVWVSNFRKAPTYKRKGVGTCSSFMRPVQVCLSVLSGLYCDCNVCNLVCMHSRLAKCNWLLKVALVSCNVACGAASTSGSASFFELGFGGQLESPGLPSTAQGSRCYRGKALQAPPQSLAVASQLRGGSIEEEEVVPGEASSPCVQHTAMMD